MGIIVGAIHESPEKLLIRLATINVSRHLLRQEKATEIECSILHSETWQICTYISIKRYDTP